MIRPIYLYGSKVLREVAKPADLTKKEEIKQLVTDLKDTLAASEGCGLAAPQIGESTRLVIVDGDVMKDVYPYLTGFRRTFVNPVILEESEEKTVYSEGCLSVPDFSETVARPMRMVVRGKDRHGEDIEIPADGLLARCLSHEIDHLNGILFVDRLSPLKRSLIRNKIRKLIKAGEW